MAYLLWDVVSWRGRDAGHEIIGDEGADHHRAPAGGLFLQRVAVKVQGGQDDRHLADLTGIACKREHFLIAAITTFLF